MSDEKTSNIIANETPNVKARNDNSLSQSLLKKANTLPKTSGCYLMKNKIGAVIYVGKAKSLKSRVTSYFNNSSKSPKTQILVSHIRKFDFILTNSEAESLVLENNLIKEHKPKYNIRLRDDKSYPYIKIDQTNTYPKLEYVRRPKSKLGVTLFGPYPVGSNILSIMKIATKAFKLRDCSEHEFNTRKTPCMLYQIKQCSAPCVNYIAEKDYAKDVEDALNLFKTKEKFNESLAIIEKQMFEAAETEAFEQAAVLRDIIEQLKEFASKSFEQSVEMLGSTATDVISFYVGEQEVDISLYLIRSGNLLGHKNFHFLKSEITDEVEQDMATIVMQYYQNSQDIIPNKLITSFSKEANQNLKEAFKLYFGEDHKIQIYGETKKYKTLLEATFNHAKESQRVRIETSDSVYIGLHKLKDLLGLKERPKLLECYDIAIWQGKSPTAAQIVFYEGESDKTQYRHYHLSERPEGNNDFAMLEEVFARRLKKDNLPDVFIVDGGIGQVNSAKKILEEFNIQIPVIGIAKARDLLKGHFSSTKISNSDERLIIPGRKNPYILTKCPSLMKIVVHMRDEAHRFSRRLHHKKEKSRIITSWVEEVRGLNESVRTEILRVNTMSLEELREFNMKSLQDYLGINSKHARAVYEFLHAIDKKN